MPVARLTAAPTRWTEDGGDVVITTSIPSRLTIRIAAGIAVRFQLTFSSGTSRRRPASRRLHAEALEALRAVQLLGRLAPLRAEVARAMHPRERRRLQLVVAVDPLRIVRREHVRLDPEARQVRRELERPLDAAAAGRREVHRDEEDLHCRQTIETAACGSPRWPRTARDRRHRSFVRPSGGRAARACTGRSPSCSRRAGRAARRRRRGHRR